MTFKFIVSATQIYDIILNFKKNIFNKKITDEQLKELSVKFASHAKFLIGEENGTTVGYIAFYCNDVLNNTSFISMIIVDDNCRGKGYGKQFIKKAIEIAQEEGMNSMLLEVDKKNNNAINFYKKLGFVLKDFSETSFILERSIVEEK